MPHWSSPRCPSSITSPLDNAGLLDYVRKHFSEFLPANLGAVGPLTDADKTRWDSDAPAGAVGSLTVGNTTKTAFLLADATPDSFTFSAVHAGSKDLNDLALIWQRRFRVEDATPFAGCIFTTRAVARAKSPDLNVEQSQPALFSNIWNALLAGVAQFVEKNGGEVQPSLLPASTGVADWEKIHHKLHQPKVPWLDVEGVWTSTDPGKRFSIEIDSGSGQCEFIEHNSHGQELKTTVPLRTEREPSGNLRFVIERPNNSKEILSFYNFSEGITNEILAKDPKPSIMTLTRAGTKLNGEWCGLSISKDATGKHLRELNQPDKAKPRLYPFVSSTPDEDLPASVKRGKGKTAPKASIVDPATTVRPALPVTPGSPSVLTPPAPR